MQTRSILLCFLLQYLTTLAFAQTGDERILFTAGDRQVTAGEFIRMYKKSSEPGNPVDIDTYLAQYQAFQLKVADACSMGLDTTRAFRNELNGYRTQLAQSYLTDNQIKEKLLQRSYQRYLIELNAWHILINCPENANPDDTLAAWTKARDIRERILQGEPFEQVARSSSDDPSARLNGGNLGYFTAFQMIMPFEDAAYSLKKGTVSEPVRTPYGYHIIKVNDRRQSKGKVLTAHIMKALSQGAGDEEIKKAGEDINLIYKELEKGASFSELAKKYSDHKESAASGGRLNWFGTGEIISEYAEAAFSITDTGKYSKPVRSPYGWHIIKLLDRKASGSFEDLRSYLESRLNQSYLNSASKKSLIEKLKKEYRYKLNETSFNWFVQNTDTLIIRGLSRYDRSNMPQGSLYTFAGQGMQNREFASYIERRGAYQGITDSLRYIRQALDELVGDQILKYENSILEKKYPEFRYLMKEFHDGILLFEISGIRVWNKVQSDTAGLREYYDSVKDKYLTERMIEGTLYTLRQEGQERKLWSAYRKFSSKKDGDLKLLGKFNNKTDSMLVIETGRWKESERAFLSKVEFKPGTQAVHNGVYPSVLKITRIIEPEALPFDKVKDQLIDGYQLKLENEWKEQLKAKYAVKVDNDVLAYIKKTVK